MAILSTPSASRQTTPTAGLFIPPLSPAPRPDGMTSAVSKMRPQERAVASTALLTSQKTAPDYFTKITRQATVIKNRLAQPQTRKTLLNAAEMMGLGLLLHRLPQRAMPGGKKTLLPIDWKVYARVALGIFSVKKINDAFDWQPPPWLGGIEAVAIITPIAMQLNKKTLFQVFKMAPFVAVIVQAASELNKRITQPLKDRFDIPPNITGLTISLAMASLGLWFSKLKWLGLSSAVATSCARGCSPGSLLCLSELGEMGTAMKNWLTNHLPGNADRTDNANRK